MKAEPKGPVVNLALKQGKGKQFNMDTFATSAYLHRHPISPSPTTRADLCLEQSCVLTILLRARSSRSISSTLPPPAARQPPPPSFERSLAVEQSVAYLQPAPRQTPLNDSRHTDTMAAAATETPNMDQQVDLSTIPISPNGKDDATDAKDDDKAVTVFHDKDNFNVKHPLQNKWTLWFTKPPSGKGDNWNDLLKEVITFDSVEEFWGVYNNVAPVSELPQKADYHLFKAGVRPEWEDPQNKHGGKWSYQYKDKRNVDVDRLWLQVMMGAIGETLEEEDDGEVMGVVVNVRKAFYRIGVWTRTIGKSIPGRGDGDVAGGKGRTGEKGKDILMSIGRRFKEVLELPAAELVEFSGHTESAHAGSTRAKAKYTV
ncbi:Translation Initiation Factor Eif4e [Tolypocladium paradoxum]|uniref:Translation Initiation Factor Eif4e n=1 Tax=Tolypocladium paradoxum TaxID=94208 RepID=A0A2S4L9L5_9HYPO|nr:Translation Initiation Factor Eif4e [Tolypocladium paradoxum]